MRPQLQRQQPNRPAPKLKRERKPQPLTDALMAGIKRIIEQSGGRHTRQTLAGDLGKPLSCINEYLDGWRSSPNAETALAMRKWKDRHTPAKIAR